ncbi:MAG: efflux RND transporter permease subunit [Acidobacteria bacterium]|nr:efflux RND transporter permease subunit [Acidobacteriota bacterium]MCB9399234.1 efflux RND transporter permease subunit [Acidobacteriota bacterium]
MIEFCLRRRVTVGMFYIGVVLLGFISYQNLSIEGQPDVELPQLVISSNWPNTPPEVVQVFLTSPIEEVSAQLDGLEEMTSSSTTRSGCQVTLKFNRDTDMEFARLDLNERLSKLRSELPPGASQPIISSLSNEALETSALITLSISGPYDLQRLSDIVEDDIVAAINSVEGVARATPYGIRNKELKIQLNRDAMDLYQLVPELVTRKVVELTRTYETARITLDNREMTVTIANSIPDLQTMQDLIILQRGDQVIRLRDLGESTIGFADVRSLARLNGNPTLTVAVEKEVGANLIETAQRVHQTVDELGPRLPKNLRIDWVADEGKLMQEQLNSVYERSLWCVALIIILLLIFLRSGSAALVITLNILFSVLITINFMYYFDITFNIVTLSGLAIGFGMLVDNAIVVLENTFRLREEGLSPMAAALQGAKEVVWAILASTLTTVAAFSCMLFLKDRLAVAYGPLVLSVIFSLSASMLVSFTFTPLLCLMIRGSGIKGSGRANAYQRFTGAALDQFNRGYTALVGFLLNHKLMVASLVGFAVFFYWRGFTELDRGNFSFFSNRQDNLMVFVRMPEGAELETADDVIRQFEQPLLGVSGYKDMMVRVNQNMASLQLYFDQDMLKTPIPTVLKSRLIGIAQGFAGVSMGVFGITTDDNYFVGNVGMETYNSSIRILGFNYKQLMKFSEDVLARVKRNRRVKGTNIRTIENMRGAQDQTETVLVIDREALRHYDIDIQYLLGFISSNLRLETLTYTKYQGEEMLLKIKFDNADEFDIKDLEDLTVRTADNQRIRLVDLVHLETRDVPGGIGRKDQQYSVLLQWEFRGTQKKADQYKEAVFAALELPPGYSKEIDYTSNLSDKEEENFVFVVLFAAALVFLIMAALYESIIDPIVIMVTVPLSFAGVVWIYQYTDKTFDSTSWVGLIILAGIVVNNSILLVSHINEKVRGIAETGQSLNSAVIEACRDRLRPVLLTALTTVIGLLPLLDDFVRWFLDKLNWLFSSVGLQSVVQQLTALLSQTSSGDANQGLDQTISMFSSLSRATVGGMISATVSTLLIIPVVYVIFFRFKQWLHARINECFQTFEGSTGPSDPVPGPDALLQAPEKIL